MRAASLARKSPARMAVLDEPNLEKEEFLFQLQPLREPDLNLAFGIMHYSFPRKCYHFVREFFQFAQVVDQPLVPGQKYWEKTSSEVRVINRFR